MTYVCTCVCMCVFIILPISFRVCPPYRARCNDNNSNNVTTTVTLTFSYPYRANSFSFSYSPDLNYAAPATCYTADEIKTFTGSAEYYVFMSTVSFIYGILAVVVYIFFYVPRYDIAKYLSVGVS